VTWKDEVVEPVFLDSWIKVTRAVPSASTAKSTAAPPSEMESKSGSITIADSAGQLEEAGVAAVAAKAAGATAAGAAGGTVDVAKCALYLKDPKTGMRTYLTELFDVRDPISGKTRETFDDVFLPSESIETLKASYADGKDDGSYDNGFGNGIGYGNGSGSDGVNKVAYSISGKSLQKTNMRKSTSNTSKAYAAERFLRIEDIQLWAQGQPPAGSAPLIVCPKGASLVMFDSVSLPHEVQPTLKVCEYSVAVFVVNFHCPR
jgi:hypothetical protein